MCMQSHDTKYILFIYWKIWNETKNHKKRIISIGHLIHFIHFVSFMKSSKVAFLCCFTYQPAKSTAIHDLTSRLLRWHFKLKRRKTKRMYYDNFFYGFIFSVVIFTFFLFQADTTVCYGHAHAFFDFKTDIEHSGCKSTNNIQISFFFSLSKLKQATKTISVHCCLLQHLRSWNTLNTFYLFLSSIRRRSYSNLFSLRSSFSFFAMYWN